MYEEYSLVKFYISDNNLNPDCKEMSIQIIKHVFNRLSKVPKAILPTDDLEGINITYKHRNNTMKIDVYKYCINISTNNEKLNNCAKNYFKSLERFMWKLIN